MKKFYLAVLLSGFICISYSQTQLFGGSNGNGNFENGSSDWVLVNGTQVSKWVVSNNATPGFTGNCMYISTSSAAPYSHTYNTVIPTYSYFYKDVAIPAGTTTLWLVFDYICNGQVVGTPFGLNAKDAFRIYGRPTSQPIVAGQELDNVLITASAGYYNQSTWKKEVRYLDATGFAGGTMRIIFQWLNDGSLGQQPPAALDNIEMYASCQFLYPSVSNGVTATTATLTWSTVSGATGYEVRYRKENEPTSVSTYTNPIVVAGGNTFSYVVNNLGPATTYWIEVRPTGTACTEYSPPLIFKTLTPPANDVCGGAVNLSVESNACEGTLSSFYGATADASLTIPCGNADKQDVWFKFTAQAAKQIIQTKPDESTFSYSAKTITLYTGTCGSLQPVAQPCAVESPTISTGSYVSRVIADGLTPGTTYYIRVNAVIADPVWDFRICVFNEPPLPQCPELLTPANNTTSVSYGIQQEFKWRQAAGAKAYKLKIIQQSGAYTEVNTFDTSYLFSPVAGINYTWIVTPYNILDQAISCTTFSFATCPVTINPNTITATGSTDKCLLDSVKLTASSATNIQWFLNNQPIAGATSDIFWAKLPGNYSVRVLNGSCYSDPSNSITIANLPTPIKPSLQLSGALAFCEGGSVTLTSSLGNINNQWFKNTAAITGSNGDSCNATTTGSFYLRVTNSTSGCPNYSDTANVVANPVPATPTITPGSAITFCEGGNVILTSNSASGNQWKLNGNNIPGATNTNYTVTTAGNYTVIVTTNGCTSAASSITAVTVNPIPATPTIAAGGATSLCTGGTVVLTSNSANGNQWYNGTTAINGATSTTYTANAAGNYSVKVTQNGCVSGSSNAITIGVNTVPATPTINWNSSQLSTVTGFAGYQWFLNNSSIAGATTAAHAPASPGLYKVRITDANGCTATSAEFNLVATGINDITLNGVKYHISPNPAKADLFIKTGGNNPYKVQMRMINANGAEVLNRENIAGTTTISIRHLPAGIYYIMLSSKKEKGVFKVVINR